MPAVERTILDIEARILQRAHLRYEEFSLTYDATDGKAKLREIVNDTQTRMSGFRQWSWLQKSAVITGVGAQTVALPRDFHQEIRVTDPDGNRPVPVITHQEFVDRYSYLTSTTGFPYVCAFPDQSHIETYPGLATGNTVTLHYLREMPEMVNDADVPDVPAAIAAAYGRALVEGAMIDVFEYAENPQMASRQETVKYPIALKELVRIAGAGYSAIAVRDTEGRGFSPRDASPYYGPLYPNRR